MPSTYPTLHAHPPEEALRAYAEGWLEPSTVSAMEKHLTACSACSALVADTPPDSVRTHIQGPHEPGAPPAAATAATALPQVPGYTVLRELGRGGMGVVYEAIHAVMGRRVAVKLLHPELLRHSAAVARFHREVRAAARLAHRNLVTAFDAGQAGERHFLAMELVQGQSLADLLRRDGPLSVAEACRIVREAALGLAHAHQSGLIHRDIKPHNLMRTADGTVKVLDFGLAALTGDCPSGGCATAPNAVMGTPDYMAPEQAEDARRADARSDVYSLGCTLFHLLTGQTPFGAKSVLLKLLAHRGEAPPSACRLRPEVPAALDAVLRRALAKRPAERFGSAGELALALALFTESGCPPEKAAPAARRIRRPRLVAGIALALLLVGLTGAASVVRLSAGRDQEVVIETDDPEVEIVVRGDRVVRIADPKTGRVYQLDRADLSLKRTDDPEGLRVTLDGRREVVLKRDGRRIATIGLAKAPPPPPASAEEKIGQGRILAARPGAVGRVHFLPGRHVALSSGDPVSLWDMRTRQKVRDLTATLGWFNWVTAVSPDGRRALLGTHLWDLETGQELRTLEGGTTKAYVLWDVRFSPDGRRALFGSHKDPEAGPDTLWLCDVETGKLLKRFGKGEGVRAVAYSPDGTRIAAGHAFTSDNDPGAIRVYEVETGNEIRTFPVPSAAGCLTFSPDGKHLLSANSCTIRLWDLAAGTQLKHFEGHTGGVEWVVFTPDSRRIVSAGADCTVRVWDVASGNELCCFRGHAGGVLGVSVSPDGRHALSGSKDGTLRLWRLPR
jgi:tRNA A-37 threonylcarbamoyl transferase component Bud32